MDDILQRKSSGWSLSPSGCKVCLNAGESIDHLFLHCEFTSSSWNFAAGLLGISFCLPRKVEDWMVEGLKAWNLKGKGKVIASCAFRALLKHMWKERNARTFEDKSTFS